MTDTNLAYLAGIIDGEGSIELRMQRSNSLDLIVHVFNSDRPLFDWIEERFGGKTYDIHKRQRVERPQWANVYNWNIGGETAVALLNRLLPFMVVKRAQAMLAVEAWNKRQPIPRSQRRWGAKPTTELIALRKSYVEQMHILNTKNRHPPNT